MTTLLSGIDTHQQRQAALAAYVTHAKFLIEKHLGVGLVLLGTIHPARGIWTSAVGW
jgi:hypothetical protein